jgi:hypothetical protein
MIPVSDGPVNIDFLVTKSADANSKGIPSAIFIEDEEKFLEVTGKTPDDVLKAMQELYRYDDDPPFPTE